jgi:hypothetical protein
LSLQVIVGYAGLNLFERYNFGRLTVIRAAGYNDRQQQGDKNGNGRVSFQGLHSALL